MAYRLAPKSVRTYRLAPEGFGAARTKLLRQRAAFFVGIVVFLLALQYKEFSNSWQGGSIFSLLPALLSMLIALAALAFGAKKGIKRSRESWLSYELDIGEDFLTRRINDFPELEIQRHEITKIRESSTGLRVETESKDRVIGIAPALVGYEDAKTRLSQWVVPTQEVQQGWITPARWIVALPLLVLVFFATFYFATRSWLIVATGVPLLVGLSWSLLAIQKSLQVSAHTRRLSFVTILPMLAIVVKLIQAITRWR
jgi:hypothetical protein